MEYPDLDFNKMNNDNNSSFNYDRIQNFDPSLLSIPQMTAIIFKCHEEGAC